jgi:DNA-binding CsgD family transcriptional regulator
VVSIETVRSHVKAVMRKLQVHSRVAAIACLEDLRETTELPLAS